MPGPPGGSGLARRALVPVFVLPGQGHGLSPSSWARRSGASWRMEGGGCSRLLFGSVARRGGAEGRWYDASGVAGPRGVGIEGGVSRGGQTVRGAGFANKQEKARYRLLVVK